jgi:hypothetical protein
MIERWFEALKITIDIRRAGTVEKALGAIRAGLKGTRLAREKAARAADMVQQVARIEQGVVEQARKENRESEVQVQVVETAP